MQDAKSLATIPVAQEPFTGRRQSERIRTFRRFIRNRLAVAGLVILLLLVLGALFAPLITEYDPERGVLSESRQAPSSEHWFGTDQIGRDIFARVLYGARVSLGISVLCVGLSASIGVLIGTYAAYRGGWLDTIVQRIAEILFAFPGLLLALSIVSAMGRGMTPLIIAIVVTSFPGYARLIRSTVLSVRTEPYIEAVVTLGGTETRIILKHVIPNIITPIIVQATLQLAGVLLVVSSLSFLGLGIAPPTPEWGGMIADGRAYMRSNAYMVWFPGFTLALAVLGFNLVGDGLRDALDRKTVL